MTAYGYCRLNESEDEATEAEERKYLSDAGCLHIELERSSWNRPRAHLDALIRRLTKGDCLVVRNMFRLAPSAAHLVLIIARVEALGASVLFRAESIDTASKPRGRNLVQDIGIIAGYERELALERQRDGIARAKALGSPNGRPATAREKASDVIRMRAAKSSVAAIAKALGISETSVYSIIKEHQHETNRR